MAQDLYARRREKVLQALEDGVLLLRNPEEQPLGRFRPNPYLYYLTGCREPGAWALLAPQHPKHRFVLFVRPRDPEREVWDGPRLGPRGVKRRLGADAAYPLEELEQHIGEYLRTAKRLYVPLGQDEVLEQRALGWLRQAIAWRHQEGRGPRALEDARELLDEMRLVKEPEEVALMREAMAISMAGIRAAMEAVRPGMYEYELEALVESEFRRRGADGPAFPSIVAAGANATILHYRTNAARIRRGDLVVLDAGACYGGYTADITRTFPASGRWTKQQALLYDIVLEAQRRAIAAIRPGAPMEAMHEAAVEALVEGLLEVGLLQGRKRTLIRRQAYRRFYMHQSGHPLGLEVHDVGSRKKEGEPRPFVAGMVLTVEPGLYISAREREVAKEWRGIGIRIEDDVLVTEEGAEVLTAALPKTREEMARLQGSRVG